MVWSERKLLYNRCTWWLSLYPCIAPCLVTWDSQEPLQRSHGTPQCHVHGLGSDPSWLSLVRAVSLIDHLITTFRDLEAMPPADLSCGA